MSDEDVLQKALDILERNEEKGMPEEAEAVVTEVETTTREAIYGSGSQYGNDDDPHVQLHFDVVYGGAVIDSGRKSMPISTGRNSQLAKYNRRYGRPEVGQEIEVFLPKDSDYWDVDISKKIDD